jgi:hypothetical protein
MSYESVEVALLTVMQDAGITNVHWPNTKFTPDPTEEYCQPFLLDYSEQPSAMGEGGTNRVDGLFQINVHSPKYSGRTDTVDTIMDAYRRQGLVADDVAVHIIGVARSAPIDDDDFFVTPVTIRYYAISR